MSRGSFLGESSCKEFTCNTSGELGESEALCQILGL